MIRDFRQLIETHPEVQQDRHGLSFSAGASVSAIYTAFSHAGVVMLRRALPTSRISAAGEDFACANGAWPGGWRRPWEVRDGDRFPAADVIVALLGSWAWRLVEQLCRSRHIAIPLSFCIARHNVDVALGLGAHQDGFGFGMDIPFSVWIPLQRIVPLENSGLGFIVPALDRVVPADNPANVDAGFMLSDPAKLWVPRYEPGDITIHSNLAAHFTTGYGTGSHRFSLEVRALRRLTCPLKYQDPALYVARRDQVPRLVGSRGLENYRAAGFLADG